MRTSLARARPIFIPFGAMLAWDPAASLQVKLHIMHDASRSHVRSDGLVKSLKAEAKPLAS